jgi:hypothetical protein
MTAATPQLRHTLKLVYPPGYPGAPREGAFDAPAIEEAPAPAPASVREATRAVIRENRRAAALSPSEAREILTMRVAELLDGGRAAVLTPERRARALRIARMLGVRDFDAHLVIAVVQDRARRGEIAVDPSSAPSSPAKQRADAPEPARMSGTIALLQLAAAVLLAGAMLLGVLTWLD